MEAVHAGTQAAWLIDGSPRWPTSTRTDIEVGHPKKSAAGVPAVAVALKRAVESMGPVRTARALLKLNQIDGFDCQGCAWPDPDPDHRHTAEFCENGAKAVAEEATTEHVEPGVLRRAQPRGPARAHRLLARASRAGSSTRWCARRDATHYEPIAWDEAFELIGREPARPRRAPTRRSSTPPGKTSNEAAFVYQLFARAFGTNNLPDCSNMCHESTSVALAETIGIGKGSVSLEDVHEAELIVISGQNPGTNHPRMLTALEKAKRNGAKIVAINPLPEAGLLRFKQPADRRAGCRGIGTGLADLHLPIRINGDLALWQAIGGAAARGGGSGSGGARPRLHRRAHDRLRGVGARDPQELDWAEVERATGLTRAPDRGGRRHAASTSDATVHCWAMGITQHRNAVATIKEFVNVALLQGNIGKPGAGLCPVRGHSNVQGDRTMGIWEKVPDHFLDALQRRVRLRAAARARPRHRRRRSGRCATARRRSSSGMGGNFVSAAPDTVGHRGGDGARRAHRAGLDQAEPLARRAAAARR